MISPHILEFKKYYNGPRGISTSCKYCGAAFVDIAYDLRKENNSNEIEVNFFCNKCREQNIIKYNQQKKPTIT